MTMTLRTAGFVIWFLLGLVTDRALAADILFSARPNHEHVRVRADSTVQSPILGELKPDTVIHVLSESWDWYRISLPAEIKGFVHSDYIMNDDGKFQIAANRVNVRSQPSLAAPILGQLERDVQVEVVQQGEEWVTIRSLPTLTGYVHSRLLTPIESK